jgi:hypothetical protein
LTNRLGASIWNRSILVLTFAASIPNHQLEIVAEKRSQQIFEFIQNLTKEQDIDKIFQGFEQTWLVDNIVENWTSDGLPILSLLTD